MEQPDRKPKLLFHEPCSVTVLILPPAITTVAEGASEQFTEQDAKEVADGEQGGTVEGHGGVPPR